MGMFFSRWRKQRISLQAPAYRPVGDWRTGVVVIAALLTSLVMASRTISAASSFWKGSGTSAWLATILLLIHLLLLLLGWHHYHQNKLKRRRKPSALRAAAYRTSDHDPLTGLKNRRALLMQGQQMLDDAVAANRSIAILLLDLDDFAAFNADHGWAAGDRLLQQVAAHLCSHLPDVATIARIGGDEFLAILPLPLGAQAAAEVADVIAHDLLLLPIAADHTLDGKSGDTRLIHASIGLAMATPPDTTMEALIRRADIAMHHSKYHGRHRHHWYSPEMAIAPEAHALWEKAIRTGIENGEFQPYFQPYIEIASGRILGFEMLMRWHSASLGRLPPERFIPLAEAAGLIAPLSLQVAQQAMQMAQRWPSDIKLSINLSAVQLQDPWVSQKLTKLMIETGFPPHRLEVEITEAAVIDADPLLHAAIISLTNQGVHMTLDNFGTGYASIASLRRLPVHRIKIDRSFIAAMVHSADAKAIVIAALRLGDSLAIDVIAKGVENGETALALSELGCAQAQGWYFGAAVDADDVAAVLAAHDTLSRNHEEAALYRLDAPQRTTLPHQSSRKAS